MDGVESLKIRIIVAWSDAYFTITITPYSKTLFHSYSAKASVALCHVDS